MSDLERWVSVPDAHDYLVSDEGRVRRLMHNGTWREIRGCRNSKGYLKVDLWCDDIERPGRRKRRQEYIHNLVLMAFVGPRPVDENDEPYHGDHGKGGQLDNSLPNLRWRPAPENSRDHYWEAS
jgi:hypothetical protein